MSGNSQVTTLDSQPKPPAAAQPPAGQKQTLGLPKNTAKSNGHDVALSGKKAMITIHAAEGPTGQDAVPIGLNGYMYQVPRATPVEVPIELLWILENAVTQIVSTAKDGNVETRNAPRFAYTVHSMDKIDS